MKNNNRIKDLNVLLEKLDISQSMIENATKKYQNIGEYLASKGIEADIYPQGSFAIGTVVRPYKDSKNKNYDLDFICRINAVKEQSNPEEIKKIVGEILKESSIYSERLEDEWGRCWTLVYAEISDIGFSMDIVPAVEEETIKKDQLKSKTLNPHLLDTAIALTEKKGNKYSWLTNNPRGYQDWFNNINAKFKEWQLSEYNRNNRSFYNSIEKIPGNMGRTSLQKVVQILKRHRDVYFIKREIEDEKPISAVITTLVADIAETAPVSMDLFDLLSYITDEIMLYSHQENISEFEFNSQFPQNRLIRKVNREWILSNPANPEDNLIDSWNNDHGNMRRFFEWVEAVKNDFVDALNAEDEKFLRGLENGLGSSFVRSSIQTHNYSSKVPELSINPAKSWRSNNEATK